MPIETYNPLGSPLIERTPTPKDHSANPEHDKFENLAGKILRVPKSELDEKLKEG